MEKIEIRKAAETDFDFFYSIKCDEDNMYWAGHTLHPMRDTLYNFFSSQIQNQDISNKRTIFIVEKKRDGKSVGYLYLDPIESDSAEISIGILQSFSGQGFGRQAVCELCKLAWEIGFKNIYAMIREDNQRSQRMFQHAGFRKGEQYQCQFMQNLNHEVKMIRFENTSRGNSVQLGSEFDLNLHDLKIVPNSVFEYFKDMNYCLFESGRSALKAIAAVMGGGQVLIPEYICESVIKCFPIDQIAFYKLKENLQIDADDLLNKINRNTAAVYLMHYFGSLQPESVLPLLREEKEKYGFSIIEDTTHSIFSQKQTVGDYCVASLRKWFALPNGGVLYSNNSFCLNSCYDRPRSTDNDKAYAMILKNLHLSGRIDCNLEYRTIFTACEEKLDKQNEIKRISDLTEFLLNCNDICEMVKRRTSNLNYLKNKLSSTGIKEMCDFTQSDCPFTLPIVVPDRDDFRKYLMENNIYCAVHWPFDGLAREERPLAVSLSNSMLSLPIDQRYGEEEMVYLLNVIDAYKGRLKL